MKKNKGITLIALVVTIIILLILGGVSIATLTGENGLLNRTSEAKIMNAIGTVKEQIKLEQMENLMDNQKNSSVEQMLADGKVKRTVQPDGEIYYMYYAIKPDAYPGMQGLGKGAAATLKDVFLIDDEFHVKYIDKSGKEYGDDIVKKILEDETEVRFASQAFSKFVSRIAGVTEAEMKFKWMKNQTSLTIEDSTIDSLEDLVFFPNIVTLYLSGTQVTTLDGVENCKKLTSISIERGLDKDYRALIYLNNLRSFVRGNGSDFDNIIDTLRLCNSIENVSILGNKVQNMSRIAELGDLKTLNLNRNSIKKIEGLENKPSLKTLGLSENKITQIEGIENLINLETLSLSYNQITDITPLSENASSITSLDLLGNKLIDGNRNNYTGERLEALNKIGEILDRGGKINIDVDKIGLFTSYKKLDLIGQNLTTLEPLEGLTELTYLSLAYNQITLEDQKSQEILKSMENLKELYMHRNPITNIKAINNLKNLKILNLGGPETHINLVEIEDIISNLDNLIVSTEGLKTIINCDVDKITKLNLSNSSLSEIPDLSKFSKLTELKLGSNPNITDFSSISKLTNIKQLELGNNNLHGRMIDFSKLTNLIYLNLGNNALWTEDLEKLQALKNNKNLTINLRSNSIIDANALLVLDKSSRIYLEGNVNLKQESKEALKERFGSNVTF